MQPVRCWGSHLSPVQSQAHIQGQLYCWRSCQWRSNSSTQSLNLGHARGRWQDESHCLWDLFSKSSKSHGICCGDSAAQNLLLKQEESNEGAATKPGMAKSHSSLCICAWKNIPRTTGIFIQHTVCLKRKITWKKLLALEHTFPRTHSVTPIPCDTSGELKGSRTQPPAPRVRCFTAMKQHLIKDV